MTLNTFKKYLDFSDIFYTFVYMKQQLPFIKLYKVSYNDITYYTKTLNKARHLQIILANMFDIFENDVELKKLKIDRNLIISKKIQITI